MPTTTVAGDVLTRWHRQKGESVWFLTGTDEHGQKVMRTAEANNVAPQAWVDKLVQDAWKPNWEHLNIANDDFIRTTEKRHTERVQKFLQSLKDSGHIYAGKYEGPYCVGCEEFKLPGDLIEIDGAKCCPIHSKPIELVNENNWFFKLSAFVEPLLAHYKNNPDACQPESARNEVVSFLEGGVSDLSISRSTFDWGIPVPWDTDQVVYVWFDALLNYATAVGLTDAPDSEGGKKFAQTWPADVHLVGKDIFAFPRSYLAGDVDGFRSCCSEEGLCSWLAASWRRKDEQEQANRYCSKGHHRSLLELMHSVITSCVRFHLVPMDHSHGKT
jgi:methionyl-tRNA synthetase